jgi:hypothetical protein
LAVFQDEDGSAGRVRFDGRKESVDLGGMIRVSGVGQSAEKQKTNEGCRSHEGLIPATAINLPAASFSFLYENRTSVRQEVQSGEAVMCFAGTPASINWRRLASTRLRKIFLGK